MLAAADAQLTAAAEQAAASASAPTANPITDNQPGTMTTASGLEMQSVPLTLPNLNDSRRATISPAHSSNGGGGGSTFASPTGQPKERMESYDSYTGSSHSAGSEIMTGYSPEEAGYMPVYLPVVQNGYGSSGLEPPPSSSGLRRQVSAPSLINVPSPQHNGTDGNNSMADFSFPDLKTPTAPAFLQQQNHQLYQQAYGNLHAGNSYSFGSAGASMANFQQASGPGIGGSPSATSADYLKNRRATLPNLQITIPSLHGGPASSHPLRPLERQGPPLLLPTLSEAAGAPEHSPKQPEAQQPKIVLQLPSFEDILAEVHMFDGTGAMPPNALQHAHVLQASLRTLDKSAAAYLWNTYKTEHRQVLVRLFSEGRFVEVSRSNRCDTSEY